MGGRVFGTDLFGGQISISVSPAKKYHDGTEEID